MTVPGRRKEGREGRRKKRRKGWGRGGKKGEQSENLKSMLTGPPLDFSLRLCFLEGEQSDATAIDLLPSLLMLNAPTKLDSKDPCLFLVSFGLRSYLAVCAPHFLCKATRVLLNSAAAAAAKYRPYSCLDWISPPATRPV